MFGLCYGIKLIEQWHFLLQKKGGEIRSSIAHLLRCAKGMDIVMP